MSPFNLASKAFCLFLFVCTTLRVSAQSDVLFTIDGKPTTVEEFKYVYEKNNGKAADIYNKESVSNYLDLYIGFKLKVMEAERLGLDTTEKFRQEYSGYRAQISQPYLNDREVNNRLIDEAYQRMGSEIRASHILIGVNPDASPADTIAAWKKINSIYDSAMRGGDFAALAMHNSTDPSVKANSGDLGYFTAFQMIYPFEEAAYNLKKAGDISKPFRTRFGYHIVKLTDRRPYRGEVKVRHIMIVATERNTPEEKAAAKTKADSIYARLMGGADFATMAKQYSQHLSSAEQGGEMAPFNSFANYPEQLKEAAFNLMNDGDISVPFQTTYGWHILQRQSLKPLADKQAMTDQIRNRISRDSRSEKSREEAVKKFKQKYNFAEKKKGLVKFTRTAVDTSLLNGNWKGDTWSNSKAWLFKLGQSTYTWADFSKWLEKRQSAGQYKNLTMAVNDYYQHWVDEVVLLYADKKLETDNADFARLSKEYREGLLLFEVLENQIWSKVTADSAGLERYYQNHLDSYMIGERKVATILTTSSPAVYNDIKKMAIAGSSAFDIYTKLNAKNPLAVAYKEGEMLVEGNPVLSKIAPGNGMKDLGFDGSSYTVVLVTNTIPRGPRPLQDIRGSVISDYQSSMEKEWLKGLRGSHKVEINQSALDALIKKI